MKRVWVIETPARKFIRNQEGQILFFDSPEGANNAIAKSYSDSKYLTVGEWKR